MVNPINIYQASLRLEASYHATVCAYQRLGCITSSESRKLLNVCTSDIKRELLEDCQIKEIDNVEVWRVSEDEVGTTIRAKQKRHSCPSAETEWISWISLGYWRT